MNEDCPATHQPQANSNDFELKLGTDAMTASLEQCVVSVSPDSASERQQGQGEEETPSSSQTMSADDVSRNAIAVLFPGALPAPSSQGQTSIGVPHMSSPLLDAHRPLSTVQETTESLGGKSTPPTKSQSSPLGDARTHFCREDFTGKRRSGVDETGTQSRAELEPEPGEDRPPTPKFGLSWPSDTFVETGSRPLHRPLSTGNLLRSRTKEMSRSDPSLSFAYCSRSTSSSPVQEEQHCSRELKFVSLPSRRSLGASSSAEGFFVPVEEMTPVEMEGKRPVKSEGAHVTKEEHLKTYFDVLRELRTTDMQLVHLDLGTPETLVAQPNGSI